MFTLQSFTHAFSLNSQFLTNNRMIHRVRQLARRANKTSRAHKTKNYSEVCQCFAVLNAHDRAQFLEGIYPIKQTVLTI